MPLVLLLLLLALLAAVAVVAAGRGDGLPEPVADRRPLRLPEERPLAPEALDGLGFSAALRGYRMDQVDAVLDRVREELSARDARIGELQAAVAALSAGTDTPRRAGAEGPPAGGSGATTLDPSVVDAQREV